MYYLNPNVENLNRIFDQNMREPYLRLDLNENPGGLPEEFVRKVLSEVTPEFVAQYPETLPFAEALSAKLGTGVENVCLVNGSSEGIRNIMYAFSSPGGRIVGVTPTYAMFAVYSEMYGRNFVPVRYNEDLTIDVDRILEAMTPETEIAIIVNPNNPMGNAYTYEEMDRIYAKARENEITLLIDEAYMYFYPYDFSKYAIEHEHVFVTRSFSKLFSLAGLRLGYVVGWAEGVKMVQKLCTPHNVNAMSMLFARRIMETPGMIESLVEKHREGRQWLLGELGKRGYRTKGQHGNFLFIQPKTDATTVVDRMKAEKGILIKTYKGVGELGECLRVTTGEKRFMERFLEGLLEIDR